MNMRTYLTAPGKLVTLFVLLSGLPLAALVWLGWRLFEQDRALENQRLREGLDSAVNVLVQEVDRGLNGWENVLTAADDRAVEVPPDAVLLVFDRNRILRHQGLPLLYHPVSPLAPESSGEVFAAAEAQEFSEGSLVKAVAAYRVLATTKDRRLRAAALMRLARGLRKLQRTAEALAVYGELGTLDGTVVAGSPSELVASRERMVLFRSMSDEEGRRRETASLVTLLSEGRLPIDRSTFDFYSESIALPPSVNLPVRLAEAVDGMWPLWQQSSGASGTTVWTGSDDIAFVALWRATPTGMTAVVGRVEILLESTRAVAGSLRVHMALEDQAGRVFWGAPRPDELHVTKTFRESALPWTLHAGLIDPVAARSALASRQNLLAASLALMALVIATASHVVFRAVNRELVVARLQSDFVATVSHEFRTPLAAMRHLTDMLEEGSTPQERVSDYHRALGKETRRLHATVDSLLDFGRLQSGRRSYRMEDTSATALAEQVVREFREQAGMAAHHLELRLPPGNPRIRGDRDALALALRNLLDNAIKYSPESSTVTVVVECRADVAGISVQDEGAGIPRAEQRDVFRRFVRGSSARSLNVKGSGLGLAMTAQVVKAHGGRLELASEPGRGSRFTILLPLSPEHA